MVEVIIPNGQDLTDEQLDRLKADLAGTPIRKLSDFERSIYGKAASKAVMHIPAFRDAIALLRPYMDATASTAYTDPYARVGLGYWFFYLLNLDQQASVLLHECMHVLNNHFARRLEVKSIKESQKIFNIAGDFEINTVLNRVPFVDLQGGMLPEKDPYNYPIMKTMEHYAELLQKDQKEKEKNCPVHGDEAQKEKAEKNSQPSKGSESSDDSQEKREKSDSDAGESSDGSEGGGDPSDSSGSGAGGSDGNSGEQQKECSCGKGDGDSKPGEKEEPGSGGNGKTWGCGEATTESEASADEAGIQKASDIEQTIAKANTAARIVEEKNRGGRGSGHLNEFWDSILQHLLPKKVDWRKVLRQVLAQSSEAVVRGRQNYTYRRVSRRLTGGEFVFPGMVNYLPKISLAIDTSGSMGNEDYQKALNEVEGLVKEVSKGKDSLSVFSVDTRVGDVRPVSSVRKIRLQGGGGTQMAVAWRFVKEQPQRAQPDMLVLCTDGYIDWQEVEEEVLSSSFKSIILVTQQGGFDSAPGTLTSRIPVICIDEGKN